MNQDERRAFAMLQEGNGYDDPEFLGKNFAEFLKQRTPRNCKPEEIVEEYHRWKRTKEDIELNRGPQTL